VYSPSVHIPTTVEDMTNEYRTGRCTVMERDKDEPVSKWHCIHTDMPLRAPSFRVWSEFGYFCAATSWRHPGARFFKCIRYVMRSEYNGSLRLGARALEIFGAPCGHQSDVSPQPIGQ
jgi:hypothetical protein